MFVKCVSSRNFIITLILNLAESVFSTTETSIATKVSPIGIYSSSTSYYNPIDNFDGYLTNRSDNLDTFSWKLLKVLFNEDQENVVFSPFSLKIMLAILNEAAGNNTQTQKELLNILTNIKLTENFREFYKKTLTSIRKENPNYEFRLETKIFVDDFIEPQQRYAAILRSYFYTDIERLNFANLNAANQQINTWCSNVTQGRLQSLVDEDSIQNSIILMANVIYFNGLWKSQFNDTYQGVFFKTESDQIKVEYMEQTEYFYFFDSESLKTKIIRLPYKGKQFSMFILLPKDISGIDNLLHNLENDYIKVLQFMMKEVRVKVILPKFKLETNKNLKDILGCFGIFDIFSSNASLPGLARGAKVAHKLKVSNIFQKTGIDVNEHGTEAFASTVVEIDNKFGGTPTFDEFNGNHPFVFFIEEELNGNIIFAGKVVAPFHE